MNEKQSSRELIKALTNTLERPSVELILNSSEEDLISTAKQVGYPIEAMNIYEDIQDDLLPILESMILGLFKEVNDKKAHYYAFARDAELFYDALWAISQNDITLCDRIHLINMSSRMNSISAPYFKKLGISNKNLRKGIKVILVDSGYTGTMFEKTLEYSRIKKEYISQIKGYLFKSDTSRYEQIKLNKPVNTKLIKKNAERIHRVLSGFWSGTSSVNEVIAGFMQAMPKHTYPYSNFNSLKNEPIPENKYIPNKIQWEDDCESNPTRVDPIIAWRLRKRTLEYFLSPNIADRIN